MAPKKRVLEASGATSSTKGGRGAIAVKENPAWRGQILEPSNASMVETHLTSRVPEGQVVVGIKWNKHTMQTTFCAASLKRLKEMKPVMEGRSLSLLGSLDQAEVCKTQYS